MSFGSVKKRAKKRDHRKLGKELDLFCFSDLVGAGLPLFTPRGDGVARRIVGVVARIAGKAGFKKVWTPHITKG